MHMVELRNIIKTFNQHTVVQDLSLQIKKGEFITLLGPSGCGKTTTLRMIAGFEQPTSGEVLLDGKHMEGLPAYERNVNTVFQSYALFPHLTAYENVAFGLRVKGTAKAEIDRRVKEILRLVQLEEYAKRKPDQLSGGQKQRIAIARALVNNPKVLLLDEPLGALDQKLRKQMQVELKHLQRQLGITFVFVTHDQEEALTMSDRIAIMHQGRLVQVGTPDEIYDQPQTTFVAGFIGEMNFLPGTVSQTSASHTIIATNGEIIHASNHHVLHIGDAVLVAVRPERTTLSTEPLADFENHLPVKLEERIYCGMFTKTILQTTNGQTISTHEKTDQLIDAPQNQPLYLNWRSAQTVVLPT
ncbi:ABC transporter ATP-binding protein [Brevibacillus sp. SYSU BS000544]|uniref:ABC transporter ATP-binding protein n=1 Tax=Brevibacillus sp. SYSU BS000544 TaxID=3416443 RepID=UPI003CE45E6D